MSTYNYVPQYGQTGFVPGQAPYYGYPTPQAIQAAYNQQNMMQQQANVPVQNQTVQAQANPQGFVCCPVTSKAEAEAYRVEAFGPPVLMPDLGHGVIYYKKFNTNTALADFAEFKFVPEQPEQASQQQTAPAIDVTALIGAVSGRFDAIDKKMDDIVERLESKSAQKPVQQKGATKE